MNTRQIVEKYFEYANAGEWDNWCDLFTEDAVYDEQLAGHIEGRETLRGMMRGFPDAYAKFENKPKHFVVDGNHAAVISHISALAMKYQDQPIEAEAVLYIENVNGKIKYAANYHDSKPFKPFLKQIGAE
jgi:ketosteroid isomerase-like protein